MTRAKTRERWGIMLYKFEIRIVSSDVAIVEASSEAEARKLAEKWHNWKNDSCDTWEEVDVQDLIEKGHKLEDGSAVFEDKKAAKSASN